MTAGAGLLPEMVLTLAQLDDRAGHIEALKGAGLYHEEGLRSVLEQAAELVRSDPVLGGRAAAACAGVVEEAGAGALLPAALYLQAQSRALVGDFEAALGLIEAARRGYEDLGLGLDALRTRAGVIHVLGELGRHDEAIAAAHEILDGVAADPVVAAAPQAAMLAGLAHQNLAICLERTGRYEDALDAGQAAEERFRSLGMHDRIVEVLNNRANVLRHLGRGTEALTALETVVRACQEAGLKFREAQALVNIGDTQLLLGNYASSLDAFDRAATLLRSLEANPEHAILRAYTADTYRMLNLSDEALSAYREADAMLEAFEMPHYHGRALWGMGSVLVAQDRPEAADAALVRAEAIFERAGNLPLLATVLLQRALAQRGLGDGRQALRLGQQALGLAAEGDRPMQLLEAHLLLADLGTGEPRKVEAHLHAAERIADSLGVPHLSYRVGQDLGRFLLSQGRPEDAERVLEAAVAEVEALRTALPGEGLRRSFLVDKVPAYEDLVAIELGRSDHESGRRAFARAERAKSRALVDVLSGMETETAGGAPGSRLRSLRADLDSIYGKLLHDAEGSPGDELRDHGRRARALEREILELRRAEGGDVDPTATGAVSAAPPGPTLLSYFSTGDETVAFVRAGGEVEVVRGLASPATLHRLLPRLSAQWERVAAGGSVAGRHMLRLQRSAEKVLLELHDLLVAPVVPALERALDDQRFPPRVVVVPHGPLHHLPFPALFDGDSYLLDRFELSSAPSSTIWDLCRSLPPADRGRALVVGVSDDRIPGAEKEARRVADLLPDSTVLLGAQATVEAFRREAPRHDSLHLACHGVFRPDRPMFSALRLADGWLTAAEVSRLSLPRSSVVLSACETGKSHVLPGDEALGLARAFLAAGALTVVVSLWLVDDESTMDLMATWYEALGTGTRAAQALRGAQLGVRDRFPHPFHWAPFVLVGSE